MNWYKKAIIETDAHKDLIGNVYYDSDKKEHYLLQNITEDEEKYILNVFYEKSGEDVIFKEKPLIVGDRAYEVGEIYETTSNTGQHESYKIIHINHKTKNMMVEYINGEKQGQKSLLNALSEIQNDLKQEKAKLKDIANLLYKEFKNIGPASFMDDSRLQRWIDFCKKEYPPVFTQLGIDYLLKIYYNFVKQEKQQ